MLIVAAVLALHTAGTTSAGWFIWLYYLSGIVIGFASVIAGYTKFVHPLFRRIRNLFRDMEGDAPRPEDGYEGRPGLMKRVSTIEYKVNGMYKEMHPNHGSSMRDEVSELISWKRKNEHS